MAQGFPNIDDFGVVSNPLVTTMFIAGPDTPGNVVPVNMFDLLDGSAFLLLNGSDFLLLA